MITVTKLTIAPANIPTTHFTTSAIPSLWSACMVSIWLLDLAQAGIAELVVLQKKAPGLSSGSVVQDECDDGDERDHRRDE